MPAIDTILALAKVGELAVDAATGGITQAVAEAVTQEVGEAAVGADMEQPEPRRRRRRERDNGLDY